MDQREVKEIVTERVGFCPKDAVGWLYAARGFYKMKDYNLVIQAVSHCLRSRKTLKEAQHLLGFSLMHTGQTSAAVAAISAAKARAKRAWSGGVCQTWLLKSQ